MHPQLRVTPVVKLTEWTTGSLPQAQIQRQSRLRLAFLPTSDSAVSRPNFWPVRSFRLAKRFLQDNIFNTIVFQHPNPPRTAIDAHQCGTLILGPSLDAAEQIEPEAHFLATYSHDDANQVSIGPLQHRHRRRLNQAVDHREP